MPDIDHEIRSCPVCQGDAGNLAASEGVYQLYRCPCGMVYTRNPLTIAQKRDHYQAVAASRSLLGMAYHNITSQIRSVPLYSHVLGHLRHYLPRRHEVNLVDVGCAGGLFLLATQVVEDPDLPKIMARGLAFEPAEKVAAEYHTGYPAYMGEEAEKLANWADVVTMLNVLEHVNHPRVFLEKIQAILKPNGLLVVDVPNNQVMIWKAGLAQRWPPLDLGEHINHFTPRTLDVLLGSQGFILKKRLPGLAKGAAGFGIPASAKQSLRWLAASFLFQVSSQRLQLFTHYPAIYQKEGRKNRSHEP